MLAGVALGRRARLVGQEKRRLMKRARDCRLLLFFALLATLAANLALAQAPGAHKSAAKPAATATTKKHHKKVKKNGASTTNAAKPAASTSAVKPSGSSK